MSTYTNPTEREIELIKKLVNAVDETKDAGEIDDSIIGEILKNYEDVISQTYYDYGNDWAIDLVSGLRLEMVLIESIDLHWRLATWSL